MAYIPLTCSRCGIKRRPIVRDVATGSYLCARCHADATRAADPPINYGGLPTAPPGDIGTTPGTVKPDYRGPRR